MLYFNIGLIYLQEHIHFAQCKLGDEGSLGMRPFATLRVNATNMLEFIIGRI